MYLVKGMGECIYIQRFYFINFFKVGSTPSIEPDMGFELMALRSRPKLRSRVRGLTNSRQGAPHVRDLKLGFQENRQKQTVHESEC